LKSIFFRTESSLSNEIFDYQDSFNDTGQNLTIHSDDSFEGNSNENLIEDSNNNLIKTSNNNLIETSNNNLIENSNNNFAPKYEILPPTWHNERPYLDPNSKRWICPNPDQDDPVNLVKEDPVNPMKESDQVHDPFKDPDQVTFKKEPDTTEHEESDISVTTITTTTTTTTSTSSEFDLNGEQSDEVQNIS
jgi:hypothetical protein